MVFVLLKMELNYKEHGDFKMSIYGHLLCLDCKEMHWIKDSDGPLDGDLEKSGEFLEKHKNHKLEYVHDDDKRVCYSEEYKDF